MPRGTISIGGIDSLVYRLRLRTHSVHLGLFANLVPRKQSPFAKRPTEWRVWMVDTSMCHMGHVSHVSGTMTEANKSQQIPRYLKNTNTN